MGGSKTQESWKNHAILHRQNIKLDLNPVDHLTQVAGGLVKPILPVTYTGSIVDSQGVWLVKKRKETPGWSLHWPPRWSAWQNTELSPPLTALCSSWIRYLQTHTHTQNGNSLYIYILYAQVSAWSTRANKLLGTHTKQNTNAHLIHPLLAMTSAWLSLSTSPKWMRESQIKNKTTTSRLFFRKEDQRYFK